VAGPIGLGIDARDVVIVDQMAKGDLDLIERKSSQTDELLGVIDALTGHSCDRFEDRQLSVEPSIQWSLQPWPFGQRW